MHASWRIRGIYILIARDRKVKKAAACYSSPSIRILRFIVEIPCPKDVGNRAFDRSLQNIWNSCVRDRDGNLEYR